MLRAERYCTVCLKVPSLTAWHYVKEGCLHLFSFFLPLFPPFCSPSLFSLFSPTTLTGILQKETKFPRMVCQLNRDLHGLVTALKPTKTTKTLIADGQPVTIHGLDCEAHYRLSRTTLSTSCFFFDLLASMSPKVLKVFSSFITSLISYLFAFNLCLFGCSLIALKQHTLLFIYCELFTLLHEKFKLNYSVMKTLESNRYDTPKLH